MTTEDDTSSFTGREVTLEEHSRDVRSWAERFTRSLALPEALANDVVLAAWLHDVGKADARFQRLLAGGSDVRLASLEKPLAKSTLAVENAVARRVARERSRYPNGYRHELLSVAMIENRPEIRQLAVDEDLVLHLVGSHHGYCRPFAPPVEDTSPVHVTLVHGEVTLSAESDHALERLDSGVSDRFWRLLRRYGYWGLAWLEAILRLADHRASEAEQEAHSG